MIRIFLLIIFLYMSFNLLAQSRGPLTLKYELEGRYGEEGGYSIFKLLRPIMIMGGFIIFTPGISLKGLFPAYNNYYFGVTDIEANQALEYFYFFNII